ILRAILIYLQYPPPSPGDGKHMARSQIRLDACGWPACLRAVAATTLFILEATKHYPGRSPTQLPDRYLACLHSPQASHSMAPSEKRFHNATRHSVKGQDPTQKALTDGGRETCADGAEECVGASHKARACASRSGGVLGPLQVRHGWKSPVCNCGQKPDNCGLQTFCGKEQCGKFFLSIPLCKGNALYFKSARNVTVNILNDQTKVLTQLITGPKAVEAYGKKFEVKTVSGKLLFSADNNEVVVGAERLRVLGAEGTVFPKSIETPNVRADPFKELRLESPTRSLVMEAPKGVEINAEAGNMEATCRTELRLESKDGEIKLDAAKIQLPRLPHGSYTPTGTRQKVFEICVCANGRLFLSQAGTGSTCQINTSVCL
ncbi:PREDICTED: delta-sarcoglycan, partial [Odobenus rosmarus divergens]|uniref:Delta-sarcoglycan n=2 Tax=Odobenus rosmarus divergens TaxID=9708 RepID=A0A9B0GRB7_ODORO